MHESTHIPPYDPRQAAFRAARYEVYDALRRDAPVWYSEKLEAWIVTGYEQVVAILLDTDRFTASNAIGIEPFDSYPDEVKAVLATGYPRFPGIIEMDPPTHTRYRNLVNTAFTPRRVAALEPRIREIANELVDDLIGQTETDFVTAFGDPLPIRVIGEILAAPAADTQMVQELSDSFRTLEAGTISELSLEDQIATAKVFVEFQQYVAEMVKRRQKEPGDDLVSVIAATRLDDGRPLELDELVSTVIHLLFAGQETTTRLIAATTYLLLRERELWRALVADPNLAPPALEEGLRMDPPVTYHLRKTKVPLEIAGVQLPADAPVHLVFASANRDDAMFEHPTRFDLRRSNVNRHLGFGRGIHFCVGAPVGRLEGRIGLEVLASRIPSIDLVEPGEPEREAHPMLSGIAHLPVRWAAAEPLPRA